MAMISALKRIGLLILLVTVWGGDAQTAYADVNKPLPSVSIGINKYDLFSQYAGTASRCNGADSCRRVTVAMARKALDDANDAGVRFVRVSMSGPASLTLGDGRNSLELWRTAPEAYWRQVDEMMNDLDARGIQIVPVLAWASGKFPLMAGEPLGRMLRDPKSKSWQLLARYVTDFVTRYRKRDTVLFYELTNELNNFADLDLLRRCHESKETCEEEDRFTADDMIAYTRRFADLIRSLDNTRQISSGFTMPRGSAEHLRARPEWSSRGPDWKPDTREQFAKNLRDIHAAVDIISIHLYGGDRNERFGSKNAVDLLVEAKRVADSVGKPLFVGEFGDADPSNSGTNSHTARMIDKIIELQIPYSAVWVWEFYQNTTYLTHDTKPSRMSLEPGHTDFLIARIRDANSAQSKRMSKPKGLDTQPPRVVLTWPLECASLNKPTDIYAVASDDSGKVKKVEFLIEGKLLDADEVPPYKVTFSPSIVGAGKHRLTARAYDRSGNAADFSTYVVTGTAAGTIGNCTISEE